MLEPVRRLSLVVRFALTGVAVILLAMSGIGLWVARTIEQRVVQNTATATAAYMESILEPMLQDLGRNPTLGRATIEAVDALLATTTIGRRVHSVKIWKEGGRIVYSSRAHLIGQTFPPTENLRAGWKGKVAAKLDDLRDDENALERAAGVSLLEIYAPIRSASDSRVIAVAELYSKSEDLRRELREALVQSWLVVGSAGSAMLLALFGIVLGGSRTIDRQRLSLEEQVLELERLLEQNKTLRLRVENAYRRTTVLNERFLRRIGADLHDGPAQLLGLALLRLEAVAGERTEPPAASSGAAREIRALLGDALGEIRSISAGLVLPELERATTNEAIELAIRGHERRTKSTVVRDLATKLPPRATEVTTCIYRLVQEGLNNAWKHSRGHGQTVRARLLLGDIVEVAVLDEGPGLDATRSYDKPKGIGLAALRERIETLGGVFVVEERASGGTRLGARFGPWQKEAIDA
jgi:signal transduction histidine kinase